MHFCVGMELSRAVKAFQKRRRSVPCTAVRKFQLFESGLVAKPLFEIHFDDVTWCFLNGPTDFALYRQHMNTIPHRHERTPKRMTINGASNLYKSSGTKELCGTRPNNIWAPLKTSHFH